MIIYTVITGGKDKLIEEINSQGAKLVCFTDDDIKSDKWEIRKIPKLFIDPRRNSRLVKMCPHIFFPEEDVTLYLDANITLKVPMIKLVSEWLEDTNIALFSHSTRDCLFDEAKECIRLELDDKEVIENHIKRYDGFPKHKGLYQGGVILRRNTPKINIFNEMWWAEYCAGCKRDQVSMPYCIEKSAISINAIKSHAYVHPYFEYFNHKKLSEWANKL